MKTISTFVIGVLLFSVLFIALPEKGYSGVSIVGCCQFLGTCSNVVEGQQFCLGEFNEGEVCLDGIVCDDAPIEPRNVPTLSEWGLIAMAGILGIVGFMVIRRKKVTA